MAFALTIGPVQSGRLKPKYLVWPILVTGLSVAALFEITKSPRVPISSGKIVQDKAVDQWVADLIQKDDSRSWGPIKDAGPEALPYIIPNLKRHSGWANTLWVKLWPKLPKIVQERTAQPLLAREARMRAVVGLREIGPNARAATRT